MSAESVEEGRKMKEKLPADGIDRCRASDRKKAREKIRAGDLRRSREGGRERCFQGRKQFLRNPLSVSAEEGFLESSSRIPKALSLSLSRERVKILKEKKSLCRVH